MRFLGYRSLSLSMNNEKGRQQIQEAINHLKMMKGVNLFLFIIIGVLKDNIKPMMIKDHSLNLLLTLGLMP